MSELQLWTAAMIMIAVTAAAGAVFMFVAAIEMQQFVNRKRNELEK